ncbi:MAG: tetratricopeptide (TPR) repeat protein [Cognaticolwellia sp.]|jgi:tetratricopeptide (TPR) repeat protein
MNHGTLVELLYTAHRRRLTALIRCESSAIWLEQGLLVHAQGIAWPSFKSDAPSMDQLLKELEQRGEDPHLARADAVSDIGLFCARFARRPAQMEPGHSVVDNPWRVRAPFLPTLNRGLRELRSPRSVMRNLSADLHTPLRLCVPSLAHLRGLDPGGRTLLVQTRLLRTPAMLLSQLSAGDAEQTRTLLRRLDLLLHLGLLELDSGALGSSELGVLSIDPNDPELNELDTAQGALIQPLESELRALRTRAVDEGPFVLLDLHDLDLESPVRRRDLQRALESSIRRLGSGPWASTPEQRKLKVLLEDARPVLKDPGALAQWVRHLRRLTRIHAPIQARDRLRAPLHLDMAVALRRQGQWSAALTQATRALELDPTREVIRVDQVLCLIALRRLGLGDALLNLAALDLRDPDDRARAQRTAERLTRSAQLASESRKAEMNPHSGPSILRSAGP